MRPGDLIRHRATGQVATAETPVREKTAHGQRHRFVARVGGAYRIEDPAEWAPLPPRERGLT